jgi:hypothetical protein
MQVSSVLVYLTCAGGHGIEFWLSQNFLLFHAATTLLFCINTLSGQVMSL